MKAEAPNTSRSHKQHLWLQTKRQSLGWYGKISDLSSMESTLTMCIFKYKETWNVTPISKCLIVYSKSKCLYCSHKVLGPQATCKKPWPTQGSKGGRGWQSTESQPRPVPGQDKAGKGTMRPVFKPSSVPGQKATCHHCRTRSESLAKNSIFLKGLNYFSVWTDMSIPSST